MTAPCCTPYPIKGPVTGYMWMPMLVFEVALALWLIVKGVAAPLGPGRDSHEAFPRPGLG